MPPPELTPEDRALLERVAARVVELRMEVPAILTLETAVPISVVAGQTLVFFEPFVAALLKLPDYRRFARLIERRDAIEALTATIERLAAERERRRKGGAPGDASPHAEGGPARGGPATA